MCQTNDCRKYEDLPKNAKKYIEKIESLVNVPVSWIGVGADRNDMVTKGFDY